MLRTVARLLAPVVLATLALGAVRADAAGDANAPGFVSRTNAARQAKGLRPFVVASDLAAVARRHSARMSSQQNLHHNPRLGSEVSGWQVVGENVGTGGTVDSIHAAFMNSPAHRANILAADYVEIGVGTVTDGEGRIWVTEIFRVPVRAPKVAAPVATRASRSVVRQRPAVRTPVVQRPVAKPAAPARPAVPAAPAAPAPVRADADAIFAALAPSTSGDTLGQALSFPGTMAALGG